jgi:hypothetical protein
MIMLTAMVAMTAIMGRAWFIASTPSIPCVAGA